MKLNNGKLSLKEKILLAIVLDVDKNENVPFGSLGFPFAPELSMDALGNWISCERTVFYSTVSRMANEELIFVENSLVKITEKGKKLLAQNFPFLFLKNSKWEGIWRIIVFDIPESVRNKRDKLRNYLIKIKFAPLSDGVWVSHLNIFGVMDEFLKDNDLLNDTIYIEGKIQKKDQEKILLYHKIMEINNEYGRLCTALKKARNLHDNDMISLLKSKFLEIYANDPHLPKELLLKDFLGDKVKRLCL